MVGRSSGIDGYGFGCPRFSLWGSWKTPSASGNLAHELPPLPGPAATLFHSTYLSSLEGSRRKTAARDSEQLCILRWRAARLLVTVSCPTHLSQAPESCLRRWLDFILHLLVSFSSSVSLSPTPPMLSSFKPGFVVACSMVGTVASKRTHGTSPGR